MKRHCKKTVKIGTKRYKKARPGELFRASVCESIYTRDQDGDTIDDNSINLVDARLYTMRELMVLFETHTGLSPMNSDFSIDSGYFDSDYEHVRDLQDGAFEESIISVSFQASERALRRLEGHWRTVTGRPTSRDMQKQRGDAQAKADFKSTLRVIDGGNPFCSRPSKAQLKLVAS